MKRRKGFTLVELLVVIAIIALLMGILMPALARVRSIAYRLVCGTNLSGIGKAMVLYANDWEEDYPTAGPRSVYWGTEHQIAVWDNVSDAGADDAYGTGDDVGTTVTSCLYLLVRGYDLPPKQFVCRGDLGTKAFELNISGSATEPTDTEFELEEAWDCGENDDSTTRPGEYCSYSYHYPFTKYGKSISISSQPSAPLGADRNPWLDENASSHLLDAVHASYKKDKYMDIDNRENSAAHSFDGQNVLYNDIHVNFEKHPNVGIQLDNIWKRWPNDPSDQAPTDKERQLDGIVPTKVGTSNEAEGNQDQKDAYLINEVQVDWENVVAD